MIKPLEWKDGILRILDQRELPERMVFLDLKNYRDVIEAIKSMKIRGAPLLGIASAFAIVLGVRELRKAGSREVLLRLTGITKELLESRPTAVSIKRSVDRMLSVARENKDLSQKEISGILLTEALKILEEDIEIGKSIGKAGVEVIKKGDKILTHCNTGALATGGFGTALGIIKTAHKMGLNPKVYVTETRPRFQGARLTTFELMKEGIPVTLITDSMVGYVFSKEKIASVIIGADRIAANGDTANKIGTYTIAVLAKEHGIPFYVAAPASTIDMDTPHGSQIKIEERDPLEVSEIHGKPITPSGVNILNPAFDITPRQYIKGIITEAGIIKPPYREGIKLIKRGKL